jgi:hypothetical protein
MDKKILAFLLRRSLLPIQKLCKLQAKRSERRIIFVVGLLVLVGLLVACGGSEIGMSVRPPPKANSLTEYSRRLL